MLLFGILRMLVVRYLFWLWGDEMKLRLEEVVIFCDLFVKGVYLKYLSSGFLFWCYIFLFGVLLV